jgi:hypothetical protein
LAAADAAAAAAAARASSMRGSTLRLACHSSSALQGEQHCTQGQAASNSRVHGAGAGRSTKSNKPGMSMSGLQWKSAPLPQVLSIAVGDVSRRQAAHPMATNMYTQALFPAQHINRAKPVNPCSATGQQSTRTATAAGARTEQITATTYRSHILCCHAYACSLTCPLPAQT